MARAKFTAVNEQIRSREVRVIGHEGENIGVLDTKDAIARAKDLNLDLIEISPHAKPPVAKIADYGKFQYDQKKKLKVQRAKAQQSEIKTIQIKVGTGENDLALKAKRVSEWLKEGHRIKLDLFLPGRTKYMDKDFLIARFDRIFNLITEEFKIAEPPKKSPKGMTTVLERK